MMNHPAKSLRRSMLFIPGDNLPQISKATGLDGDSIVIDLEDGVAFNRKEEARRTAGQALQTLDFGRRERLIRLNSTHVRANTEEGRQTLADLTATIDSRPDGYVLPKVESAAQIKRVANYLRRTEQKQGWPAGLIRLLAIVETARGVMNLKEIAAASTRLEALLFGAEALAGTLGAHRTRAGWEVFYARSAVVTAAAAYDLQAVDMFLTDSSDAERLERECLAGRRMGYTGKMTSHPRQVEVINRIFAPSPEEIEQALRLVHAHKTQHAAGSGVFVWEGKMVDRPRIRAAERVLARARLAGLLEEEEVPPKFS